MGRPAGFALWRSYLRVLFVEVVDLWEARDGLVVCVEALQELAHVVVDQVVLEHRHDVRVLVVNYVVDDLHVVVVAARQVLPLEVLLRNRQQRLAEHRAAAC